MPDFRFTLLPERKPVGRQVNRTSPVAKLKLVTALTFDSALTQKSRIPQEN
jgi:hypothetical protein